MSNRRRYIADAHALIWYVLNDPKLGANANSAFDEVDNDESYLIIPSVVLAEVGMIVQKERVPLPVEQFQLTLQNWHQADNIILSSLSSDLVLFSMQFTVIPDIFDRLIVAEARLFGLPLITKDAIIIESELVTTIW